jgi:hypothetical protein
VAVVVRRTGSHREQLQGRPEDDEAEHDDARDKGADCPGGVEEARKGDANLELREDGDRRDNNNYSRSLLLGRSRSCR